MYVIRKKSGKGQVQKMPPGTHQVFLSRLK